MGFFFNDAKGAEKAVPKMPKKLRLQDIPVESLRQMGCSVCPRDKDAELRSPKMEPSGPPRAKIYLLGAAPSQEEDEDNNHWTDKAGSALREMFGEEFMRKHVRSNFIQQCRGPQTQVEVECCRNRVVADVEACRPEVIMCVGDAALQWATGLSGSSANALTNRGTAFATRVGRHRCVAFSVIYPNFVHKKGNRKSEHELALRHDVETVKAMSGSMLEPFVADAPYDAGIEIVTGDEPGDMQRLAALLAELAHEPRSTVDLETTGLRPYMLGDEARIISAAVGTYRKTASFAVDHPDAWGSQRTRDRVKRMLLEYLMASGRKCAHGLDFEMEWIGHAYGEDVLRRTEWDDTIALAHTLDERPGTKSLNHQTRINFGFFLKEQSRVDVKRPKWWLEYSLREILRYNGMDTKWGDALRDALLPKVAADPAMLREYERKVRLAPTLVRTQAVGLDVDFGYARAQEASFEATVAQAEKRLKACPEVARYEQQFGTFAPGNDGHVLRLYKDVMGRPEVRVQERDGRSRDTTEEEVLAALPAAEVPSAKLVLEHRAVTKLLGTYVRPCLARKWVCPDGKIRTRYNQYEARTGRLASEDPNAQNWPVRKHKEVRGIIVPPAGHWLVPCDYGQIEFRVVGMASEDRNLVKYCWTNYDVHGHWAQRMVDEHPRIKDWIVDEFEIDWDEKGLKALRQESKNGWVFPMFFGALTRSCADRMHLPDDVANDLAAEFWDEFRGVKEWQEGVLRKYERDLYVETLDGRKRRGALTRNQIINHPIQGTALDIVTEAMAELSERAEREGDPELNPALNVHDDLTFLIRDERVEEKVAVIAREMCMPRFDYVNVPLVVEVKAGRRWHACEEIAKFSSEKLFGLENPYA